MKEVIPFYKEIVFKTNIACITSISLEHEENVLEGEISGNFIVFGKYKVHNDTTEELDFKYKLPFTTLIPDNIDKSSIVVDIDNFTFDQIEEDVLRIDIDFSIEGETMVDEDNTDVLLDNIDREIDEILCNDQVIDDSLEDNKVINEALDLEPINNTKVDEIEKLVDNISELERNDNTMSDINNINEVVNEEVVVEKSTITEEKNEESEYVTYHVHLVKENETIEQIVAMYNVSIDYLKEYNEISQVKVGDKLIIPDYGEE